MKTFKQTDLAWAAGFFDGEGSTSFAGGKQLVLGISQASDDGIPEVLLKFKEIFGIGNIYMFANYRPYIVKQLYRYVESRFEGIQYIYAALWPYLSSEKKKQIIKSVAKFNNRVLIRKSVYRKLKREE